MVDGVVVGQAVGVSVDRAIVAARERSKRADGLVTLRKRTNAQILSSSVIRRFRSQTFVIANHAA